MRDRWRDVHGTPIAMFRWVEQIAESTERTPLPSHLHQHGQVVGLGEELLFVRFEDDQVVSLRPHLVRVLDAAPEGG
jgi:hypothetical protein